MELKPTTKVAEALEQLPERERVAVLLRDSYALSPAAVAVALAFAHRVELDGGVQPVASWGGAGPARHGEPSFCHRARRTRGARPASARSPPRDRRC